LHTMRRDAIDYEEFRRRGGDPGGLSGFDGRGGSPRDVQSGASWSVVLMTAILIGAPTAADRVIDGD